MWNFKKVLAVSRNIRALQGSSAQHDPKWILPVLLN